MHELPLSDTPSVARGVRPSQWSRAAAVRREAVISTLDNFEAES